MPGTWSRRIQLRARPLSCYESSVWVETRKIISLLNDLALSRTYQGDHVEGKALMHEVVALDTAIFGPSHPYLASHLENLGLVYGYGGFEDSNVVVLKQALAMRKAVLADDNPAIWLSLFNLGTLEYQRKAYAQAEPLLEEGLARMRRADGEEHPDVVWATAALGRTSTISAGGPRPSGTCDGR